MWMAKGLLLGIWFFSFGTIAYFIFFLGFKPTPGTATDLRTVAVFTVSNPSWWLWLGACLSLGLIAARSWPGRGVVGSIVWIGLAVTELIPVALLTVVLVMASRLKAMTK